MVEPILQPLNEEQKKDIIDIHKKTRTPRDQFLKQLRNKQQEHTTNHTPFCFRCAKTDYEEQEEQTQKKKANTYGIQINKTKINLNEYAKKNRFELLREQPIIEQKLIDGIRQDHTTGKWQDYKCLERGCRISVQVPK